MAADLQKRKLVNLKTKKTWIEVSLPVDDMAEESITNFLFEMGAQGCQTQQGVLRGYFLSTEWSEQKSLQLVGYLEQLIQLGFSLRTDHFEVQTIKSQDWNAEWKKSYKPIEIGERIIIKPSWIKQEQDSSKEVIEIDPQMAFGTGTHATSQLVIGLLQELHQIPGRILDIGTGTGILAIVAARLFNSKVFAFDNDYTAAATAKQNFINNDVADKIEIFCCDNLNLKYFQFDLVLANINRNVIIQLLPEIKKALKPDGMAILSGILEEEKEKIFDKLNCNSLRLISERKQGEWVGLIIAKV